MFGPDRTTTACPRRLWLRRYRVNPGEKPLHVPTRIATWSVRTGELLNCVPIERPLGGSGIANVEHVVIHGGAVFDANTGKELVRPEGLRPTVPSAGAIRVVLCADGAL